MPGSRSSDDVAPIVLKVGDNSVENNFGEIKRGLSPTEVGPRVVRFERFGIHCQQVRLVVTFSMSLDPAMARDSRCYTLSTSDGRVVPTKVIRVDSAKHQVVLEPLQRGLNEYQHYELKVSRRLCEAGGLMLNATPTSPAGADTLIKFDHTAIVGYTTKKGKMYRAADIDHVMARYFPTHETTKKGLKTAHLPTTTIIVMPVQARARTPQLARR